MTARTITVGAAAIASGLVGGVLFAFSSFVMPGLRRIPPAQGIAAMQSINRQATTFAFMTLVGGTALLAVGLGVQSLLQRGQPAAGWVGAGSISVVVALAITGGYNVPRNDRLATFDATNPEAARYWSTYLTEWIMANHVRTAFCVLAAVCYTVAVRRIGRIE